MKTNAQENEKMSRARYLLHLAEQTAAVSTANTTFARSMEDQKQKTHATLLTDTYTHTCTDHAPVKSITYQQLGLHTITSGSSKHNSGSM